MPRKQRMTAKADKRVLASKLKAATQVNKKRVRFADAVDIIYFDVEPSAAGSAAAPEPAPISPEAEPSLTALSQAELWDLADAGSAEAEAEVCRRGEESSRLWHETLDELYGPRRERPAAGSWQEKMELDEAMDRYRRGNLLDTEAYWNRSSVSLFSRGWKCYAAEIGACEPELHWDERLGFSYSHVGRNGAMCCIHWDWTTGGRRPDLHSFYNRRDRGDPTFMIPVEHFGILPNESFERYSGCKRCRRVGEYGPEECRRGCRKRVAALPHNRAVWDCNGKLVVPAQEA